MTNNQKKLPKDKGIGEALKARAQNKQPIDIAEVWKGPSQTIQKTKKQNGIIIRKIIQPLQSAKKKFISELSVKTPKTKVLIGLVGLFFIGGTLILVGVNRSNVTTDQLGVSDTNDVLPTADSLPKVSVESLEFPVMLPSGKTLENTEVVKINPPNNDTVYAYLDQLEGVSIRVSQQLIPDNFKGDQDNKLEELAADFQATSIISIDGEKVYHGYSEQGGIQSLVFIKNNNLFFIASSRLVADDTWVSYILSLN